jgi:hypothetical protein
MATTITTKERGIALISLTGIWSLEALTDFSRPVTLRVFDEAADGSLTDIGALNLRDWDTNTAPLPGNGYEIELRDHTRRTLLATGTVSQRGVRAAGVLTFAANPVDNDSVTITYPDLSDESVATPPIVSRTYTYKDTAVITANQIRTGATALESLNNLVRAINGDISYGDTWSAGPSTDACVELVAFRSENDEITLEARDGGVWANIVTTLSAGGGGTRPSWASGTLTGGTGRRGLNLQFSGADLPNTLMESDLDVARLCYFDVVGLDSGNNPTKIAAGPADLHATATNATD